VQLFAKETLYKDRILAADDHGMAVTYQELDYFSDNMYHYIKRKSLIFLLCENTIGCLLGYLSCLKTGGVPLMLNAHINQMLLNTLIKEYHPEFLYLPESCLNLAEESEIVWRTHGYCLCRRKELLPTSLYEELALLMTTSGSTGSPKLVRQSGRNILANAEAICKYLEINGDERPVTTLPMNYTYGLSIINTHVLKGATLLLTTRGIVERPFWDFAVEMKATSFGGVPNTYQILKRIGFMNMNLPDLKTMTQAGGKLPLNLHEEFAFYAQKTEKRFVVMYGQTEATARMGYLPPPDSLKKCGSMGIAIPGGRFWLEGDTGKKITEPEIQGELVYEGKNVALGYACYGGDLEKQDEWHGVLHTGDIAKQDREGYFYITGRKKRFIKLSGNRVSLDEVEHLFKAHFENMDFACIGIDDQLKIFTDCKDPDAKEFILEYFYQMTGLNTRSIEVISLDIIPQNESGKILYEQLESVCH